MNETWLKKFLESKTGTRSAIIIIMRNNTKVSKFYFKRSRFGGMLKAVDKY